MLTDIQDWLRQQLEEGSLTQMASCGFSHGSLYAVLAEAMNPCIILFIPDKPTIYPLPGVKSQLDEIYTENRMGIPIYHYWWDMCNQFKGIWRVYYDDTDDAPEGYRAVWFFLRRHDYYDNAQLIEITSTRAVINVATMWDMNYETLMRDAVKYHGAAHTQKLLADTNGVQPHGN